MININYVFVIMAGLLLCNCTIKEPLVTVYPEKVPVSVPCVGVYPQEYAWEQDALKSSATDVERLRAILTDTIMQRIYIREL